MKRIIVLLTAVLALSLAACGSDQTDASPTPIPTPATTPTEEPTEIPTPEPTETPDATDDDGSASAFDGELSDALPDEVAGLAREDMPPQLEQIMASAMAQAGAGAEDAEIAWGMYGEGELMVIAMRMPEVAGFDPQQWAQMMAAMAPTGPSGEQLNAEPATVAGKEVLRMTPDGTDAEGTVYVYQVGDAFFTVVAQEEGVAEELLSLLP